MPGRVNGRGNVAHEIRVGIAGIGNNASSLVQGVYWYSQPDGAREASAGSHGILFPRLCGYEVQDIEFSAAFEVDSRKIGRDLGTAIFSSPNCYPRALLTDPKTGVIVQPAPLLDGVPGFLADMITVAPQCAQSDERMFEDCVKTVRESETSVLINFLPAGSDHATLFFAQVAAAAGASYINCTPSPAVHSSEIAHLFEETKLPLLGDDLESQFGSSLLHRTLLGVLETRGLEVVHSYQLNLGGNTDFKNLFHRGDAKKYSKMKAISPITAADRVEIVPSGGFVRGLGDSKVGYIVIEGRGWLGMPVTLDLKLKVQDSSNASGVVVDLIRVARGAMERKLSGDLPLSYYFKNPRGTKLGTDEALEAIRRFDRGGPLA